MVRLHLTHDLSGCPLAIRQPHTSVLWDSRVTMPEMNRPSGATCCTCSRCHHTVVDIRRSVGLPSAVPVDSFGDDDDASLLRMSSRTQSPTYTPQHRTVTCPTLETRNCLGKCLPLVVRYVCVNCRAQLHFSSVS